MHQSDDKPRGGGVREASRLRATLGSEPNGGYAFHDKGRVDRVRPASPDANAQAQAASHAPGERSFARTLVGGMTIQEALAGRDAAALRRPANDQARPIAARAPEGALPSARAPESALPSARAPESALPSARAPEGALRPARGSWPPMPHVPSDLVGSIDRDEPVSGVSLRDPSSSRPPSTYPRPRSVRPLSPSTPPAIAVGGAIWQAMPSVVEQQVEPVESTGPQGLIHVPRRNSSPAPYRPSLEDVEAEQARAYGDPRVVRLEPLVERNAWEQVYEELKDGTELSPTLQLLRIVARRETLKDTDKGESARTTQQAIACIARILDLPETSPTALVLGKRLLRKNPGWARTEPASRGLSLAIVVSGLSIGAGIGWLLTRLLF